MSFRERVCLLPEEVELWGTEETLKMEPTSSQVHSDGPVTDRAHRYRATNAMDKPKGDGCALCESKRNLRIDHADGDETNDAPGNLRWLCHACNIKTGLKRKADGTGRRVDKSDLEVEFGDDIMEEKTFNAEIIKVNTERKQVFGWASLISKGGVAIEDTQEDIISADDLEKMAYRFVGECRVGGEMHKRKGVGNLIESLVLTVEKAAAMGIELPGGVEGWWTGWQVTDDDVWDKVKKGEYKAFSIHGVGVRTKIDKE